MFTGLAGIFMCAGGLGLATSSAATALFWLPFILLPAYERLRQQPAALFLGFLAIGWTALSLTWSPYDRPDQAIKLLILTPFFILFPFAITLLSNVRRQRFGTYFAFVALLTGTFFLFEGIFGAPLSTGFKINFEGHDDWQTARPLAERALSRGASAFILAGGPIAIWMWLRHPKWRWAAIYLALSLGVAASAFEVEANVVALSVGLVCGVAAIIWPRRALQSVLCAGALWLLTAPVAMSLILAIIPDGLAEALPLSWQMRLVIWDNAIDFIAQAPVFGHGLDASRILSTTATIDGFSFEALPLHPHNFGLNIWLETGSVGAGLFAVTLIALALAFEKRLPPAPIRMSLAYAITAWLVMVMLGYGVWQEWHHGALSLAIAICWLNASGQSRRFADQISR